ncbi:hypothetical protein GGR58DRAFT_502167 [Xylaria digitata]|nr:hypothetical protein GGR58DRAFT_502167 [Xylaria digitata]
MSTTTDHDHSAATKEAEQATTETISTNDTSTPENGTDSGTSNENLQQTGRGPKVLRSHYRGMPKQWEKNLPKKDGE